MSAARHTRVWPTAAGYAALVSESHDPTTRAAVELWSARGWPFVVRRPEGDEPHSEDTIAIGLPLPPSLGKERLKLRLLHDEVAMRAPPLTLDDVIALSNSTLRRMLAPLARAAARARVALRVFGSAAWQAQTGLDYWFADSDIDLLVEPSTLDELDAAIAWLGRTQRRVAMRLDGEIVFPGGDAVAWREWARDGENRVLVKGMARVALTTRSDLLSRFERNRRTA